MVFKFKGTKVWTIRGIMVKQTPKIKTREQAIKFLRKFKRRKK